MKCPKCNCEDIAITVQYHKSTICRIIKYSCALIAIILLACTFYYALLDFQTANSAQIEQSSYQSLVGIIDNQQIGGNNPSGIVKTPLPPQEFGWFIIFSILAIVFYGIQLHKEQQPIMIFTCKECGKTWTIKD